MDREAYLNEGPFAVSQANKDGFFQQEMKNLSEHHRRTCKAYDDICNGLSEETPYLPVALFKDLELRSVEPDQVVRQVTSSGTTGQKVSRIFLDAETSEAQRRALCTITGDFIGTRRMPMLIIDSPDVLKDRRKFSARGAGILGFSMMSSRRYYALDENMQPDWESIAAFAEKAKAGPSFAFGFTFMIWAYFYRALKESGRKLDLSGCYLIHGGGWKKLQDQKVSDEEFKAGLKETCNIDRVSDYYGMAEQTGSIFMECECGRLHASTYSDITILDPEDFSECETGEWGLIALRSWLPGSYPGHMLLTEDWGRILGTDDCPCGRKGRYFEIQGRISKAEIRGCSDTFEGGAAGSTADAAGEDLQILAGTYPPADDPVPCFDPQVITFLEELSALFMKDPAYRQYPDIYALGFWLRKGHLDHLKKRQEENCGSGRKGKGLVLHIAPSNMPTMFAYSWITALLAGNSSVVRLSGKDSEISSVILQGIRQIMGKPEYEALQKRNAFIRFPRDHRALAEISQKAAARMIWGGDETVRRICEVPGAEGCIDIPFPDKYSIALLDTAMISGLSEEEMQHQAHLFYRDTYGADQNACSSPRSVFWVTKDGDPSAEEAKQRWWEAVLREAARYDLQPWMATEKYRMLCCAYAEHSGLKPAKRSGNRLYVVPCVLTEDPIWKLEGKMGIFYEYDITSCEELYPYLDEKVQTIVRPGGDQEEILEGIRQAGCAGCDRVVSTGEALDFDTIWDRKDLIHLLSE